MLGVFIFVMFIFYAFNMSVGEGMHAGLQFIDIH